VAAFSVKTPGGASSVSGTAKRCWGYFALPMLHDDRLIGKVDAADRKASMLRVHAIHEDLKFTRTTVCGRDGTPRSR
jgi:uncharacterized protein YcaQ